MNTVKWLKLFLLLGLCSVTGMAEAQDSTSITIDSSWQSVQTNWYELSYPAGWDLDTSGMHNSLFFVFSPPKGDSDQFRENINLMSQDLTGHQLDLDLFVELSLNQLPNYIYEAKVVVNEQKTAHGKTFQHLMYTGKQVPYQLTFDQYVWVENEKAYILTLTSEEEQYEYYQPLGALIMDSFQFKPQ